MVGLWWTVTNVFAAATNLIWTDQFPETNPQQAQQST